MLLKLFFCVFAVCICSYIGFSKSKQYKDRVHQLETCELFLSRLSTYLSSDKTSTKVLFSNLSQTNSLSELTFIKKAGNRLASDSNFPKVWEESIDEARCELALTNDDYIPLLSLCELIGSYDTEGVLNGIELSKQLIKQAQTQAYEQSQTNGKLARSLGVLSGIAVAILIV